MYTHEEQVDGRPLSEIINEQHVNVKYLPGITLPDNVVADPDIASAVRDATALVFVLPHQFIASTCRQLKPHLSPNAKHAISLTKGVDISDESISMFPDVIQQILGLPCDSLSGANIANESALAVMRGSC